MSWIFDSLAEISLFFRFLLKKSIILCPMLAFSCIMTFLWRKSRLKKILEDLWTSWKSSSSLTICTESSTWESILQKVKFLIGDIWAFGFIRCMSKRHSPLIQYWFSSDVLRFPKQPLKLSEDPTPILTKPALFSSITFFWELWQDYGSKSRLQKELGLIHQKSKVTCYCSFFLFFYISCISKLWQSSSRSCQLYPSVRTHFKIIPSTVELAQ